VPVAGLNVYSLCRTLLRSTVTFRTESKEKRHGKKEKGRKERRKNTCCSAIHRLMFLSV
jgi:hypothetical protein